MNNENMLADKLKAAAHPYQVRAQSMDVADSVMARLPEQRRVSRDPLWPLALAASLLAISLLPLSHQPRNRTPIVQGKHLLQALPWQTGVVSWKDPAQALRKEQRALTADLDKLKKLLLQPLA
jgi:hypothetical protein